MAATPTVMKTVSLDQQAVTLLLAAANRVERQGHHKGRCWSRPLRNGDGPYADAIKKTPISGHAALLLEAGIIPQPHAIRTTKAVDRALELLAAQVLLHGCIRVHTPAGDLDSTATWTRWEKRSRRVQKSVLEAMRDAAATANPNTDRKVSV
jgi:hypothetical protein